MRLLLLATNFGLQYRALRCVAALGEVYVLGSGAARSLALSRFCKRFIPFSFEADDLQNADRLDEIAADMGADLIVPADLPTVRFLARVRPHLQTGIFPLSDSAAIEALGGKDRFMKTCRQLSIPHPPGALYENKEALLRALARGSLRFPLILKPTDFSGGIGVMRVDAENARREIERLNYAPILAQQFVPGIDRCISLFCREGEVLRQVIYEHSNGAFRFLEDTAFSKLAARMAAKLKLTGAISFDARIAPDGKVWMIECNPRFTFNMDVAMVAGMNFADWRIPPWRMATVRAQEICLPDALLRGLLGGRKPRAADVRMLLHWLRDPLLFVLVALGYQQRWRWPFFEKVLTSGKCAA